MSDGPDVRLGCSPVGNGKTLRAQGLDVGNVSTVSHDFDRVVQPARSGPGRAAILARERRDQPEDFKGTPNEELRQGLC